MSLEDLYEKVRNSPEYKLAKLKLGIKLEKERQDRLNRRCPECQALIGSGWAHRSSCNSPWD